jgi:hypothetical protein
MGHRHKKSQLGKPTGFFIYCTFSGADLNLQTAV